MNIIEFEGKASVTIVIKNICSVHIDLENPRKLVIWLTSGGIQTIESETEHECRLLYNQCKDLIMKA